MIKKIFFIHEILQSNTLILAWLLTHPHNIEGCISAKLNQLYSQECKIQMQSPIKKSSKDFLQRLGCLVSRGFSNKQLMIAVPGFMAHKTNTSTMLFDVLLMVVPWTITLEPIQLPIGQ